MLSYHYDLLVPYHNAKQVSDVFPTAVQQWYTSGNYHCYVNSVRIKILVNRGYVPKQRIRPETRMKGQVSHCTAETAKRGLKFVGIPMGP